MRKLKTPRSPHRRQGSQSLAQELHDAILAADDLTHDRTKEFLQVLEALKSQWPNPGSHTEFAEFLEECRDDDDWHDDFSITDVVNRYVKPRTSGTGLGYALLVNEENPKEVTTMISHAWQENALDFCETLQRSVEPDEPLFICALSLYQCDDGKGPTIQQQLGQNPKESPFRRVLQHIQDSGKKCEAQHGCWRNRAACKWLPWVLAMVALTCLFIPILARGCVPMHDYCAFGVCTPVLDWLPIYSWRWEFTHFRDLDYRLGCFVRTGHILGVCAVLLQVLLRCVDGRGYIYKGRMVAVPNHNVDMYSRLWCVFEMYIAQAFKVPVKLANTMAYVGDANAREATCSSPMDTAMIRSEIESYGQKEGDVAGDKEKGYTMVDRAIRIVSLKAWQHAVTIEVLWGWPLALSLMCFVRLVKKGLVGWWEKQAEKRADATWFQRVKYLATHGRLGYDLFCSEVFEASSHAFWVWGLVFGVLVGYCFVIGTVVHYARKTQGRTPPGMWLFVAFLFVMSEGLLNVCIVIGKFFGICNIENENMVFRINWFIIGLSAALSQGSAVIFISLLVDRCMKSSSVAERKCQLPSYFGSGQRRTLLLTLGVLVLASMLYMTCRLQPPDPDHIYPTFVFNVSMVFGGVFGPLAMAWTSLLRWGVFIDQSSELDCFGDERDGMSSSGSEGESGDEETSSVDEKQASRPLL
eukprot:TRINITY_DN14714_c0_g7_i2.p1 TRINITY_DN14714_c0_g7~~TRINITY_DN14714_c0_g7_i2.p1  ORF type:complete len:695 (-),score=123.32 TRINITY_DN14714_c0_g7_i2:59-2143(-)